MDLDRYLATHRQRWERLEELSKGGRRKLKARPNAEVEELIDLYQRVSSDLSHVRTYFGDPALVSHLTQIVGTAGNLIYGTRPRTYRALTRFFSITFPAALWHTRKAIALSTAAFFIPALIAGIWIANSPDAVNAMMTPAERNEYVNEAFEDYYASEQASEFSAQVFTNNMRVGLLAFGAGIALGIPTLFVLAFNGFNIGLVAGLFDFVDQNARFWTLITPHGLLEITAILLAGAAGLRLGWSIVSPGDQSRVSSLSSEARRAVAILIGLFPVFLIAGLIEGFVTGQPWPALIRVGIGVVVEVAFLLYVFHLGRRAALHGFSGELGEQDSMGWAQHHQALATAGR